MSRFIVGREAELQAVQSAVVGPAGGCLLFQGESGIGKSVLLELAAEKLEEDGALVLWAESWDSESTPAYWPWVRVAENLIDHMGIEPFIAAAGDVGPLIGMVPSLGGPASGRSLAGRTSPFDIARPLGSVLKEKAEDRLLVLIFDDLHAADEASVELLHLLMTSLRRDRVFFLGAYREPDGTSSERLVRLVAGTERIVLTGLSLEDIGRFYELTTTRSCGQDLARELFEASGGHPLYLREVISALEEGDLRRPDHSVGFRVPRGLKSLLRLRLSLLEEGVVQVLAAASVIGRRFDLSLLGEVYPVQSMPLAELMDRATESNILREVGGHGEYEFTQVMLRELMYGDLRSSERMRLHAVIGQVLERRYGRFQDDHVAEIAHHFFKAAQAGDQKKTLDYLVRAADEAAARDAVAEAKRNYHRALKVAELMGWSRSRRDGLKRSLAGLEERDSLTTAEPASPENDEVFRQDGEFWTLAYQGRVFRLKDSKGLRYLHQLLATPGRESHVLEMAALAAGTDPDQLGRRGDRYGAATDGLTIAEGDPILDPRAKEEFRKRLSHLQEEIEDAELFNDPERASRARTEMDQLTEALAAAAGLGGRDRTLSLEAERARLSVSKAVRSALAKVDANDAAMGAHLAATVRTGYYCSYVPDPRSPLKWDLGQSRV